MAFETVIVAHDGEFKVCLKSTPATGYVWEILTLPEGILLLGNDYEKPASGIQPGDPVSQVFRFRALTAGEHIINFALKRPWKSDAIESHMVTIKVV